VVPLPERSHEWVVPHPFQHSGVAPARRHHGAFFLVYLLLLYVQSWQDLYAATTVQMQVIPN